MKHFSQFLIIAISWKYVRRRPICFVMAPRVGVFHSPAIFAVLHWSFVFKHWTLLCFCLNLVTISVGRKSKDHSFWWRSLHQVNTSWRCVLDDQWRRYSNYSCTRILGGWSPYLRTRIRVSIGTTHVWVSGWICKWQTEVYITCLLNFICFGLYLVPVAKGFPPSSAQTPSNTFFLKMDDPHLINFKMP